MSKQIFDKQAFIDHFKRIIFLLIFWSLKSRQQYKNFDTTFNFRFQVSNLKSPVSCLVSCFLSLSLQLFTPFSFSQLYYWPVQLAEPTNPLCLREQAF